MKKLILIAFLGFFLSNLSAQDSGLGVGIIFGEPTGLSLKTWLSSNNAVDAAAAWSLANDWLYVHADYLRHNFDLINVSEGQMPVYFGIGAVMVVGDQFNLGARVPLGLDYMFDSAPLDIFVEIAPTLVLLEGTDFYLNGGIGIRFWL